MLRKGSESWCKSRCAIKIAEQKLRERSIGREEKEGKEF